MERTIPNLLAGAVEAAPDADWLFFEEQVWTYRAAWRRVRSAAAGLADRGVGRGDLVLVPMRNTAHHLFLWLGLMELGAVLVAANPAASEQELEGLIGQTEAKRVLADDDVERLLSGADIDGQGSPQPVPVPDDPAVLIPTSGTTGRSKLVTQTHRAYVMAGEGFPWWMELSADDRLTPHGEGQLHRAVVLPHGQPHALGRRDPAVRRPASWPWPTTASRRACWPPGSRGPAPPSSLQGAVAAGLLGAGNVFFGVVEDTARFLAPIAEADSEDAAEQAVAAEIAAERRIPGLGHPVHQVEDPRTPRLYAIATEAGIPTPHLAMLRRVAEAHAAATGKQLPINGAGVAGAAFADLGFAPEIVRGFAVLARTAGLVGHLAEEMADPIGRQLWLDVEHRVNDTAEPQ